MTISLCMIVKNEEALLARCLESVQKAVDEIIIVDTGSTDATKEIALQFTSHVLDFQWCDDFSAARNFSFSQASCDYILWLDADDILKEEDKNALIALKSTLEDSIDAVLMRYDLGFDEDGSVAFSCWRERLLKRSKGYRWEEPVHEGIPLWGKIVKADIAVTHAKPQSSPSTRNLDIYRKLLARGETLSLRGTLYYARELKQHGYVQEAAAAFERFLGDGGGWCEDCIRACCELARCYDALGQTECVPFVLVRSFAYGLPRAEACCMLGSHYRKKAEYTSAIFWYELALRLQPPKGCGLVLPACYGSIPAQALSGCCEQIGDTESAQKYRKLAQELRRKQTAE